MKKERIELLITITGAIVFVALLIGILGKIRNPAVPRGSLLQEEVIVPKTDTQQIAEAKKRDLVWGRDPFALKAEEAIAGATELILNGIIWDDKRPYAIINGEIVGKGDKMGEITIMEIRKDSVIIDTGAEKITLSM